MSQIRIKQAIVSVSDKSNLEELSSFFYKNNIKVLSSGGTFDFLKKINSRLMLTKIENFTKFKEILDGRVKTLHPLIHAGILANKNKPDHLKQIKEIGLEPIDLVVTNLYPFEKISSNPKSTEADCIENIDIGGPSLIRGAAKNFESVAVLTSPDQYGNFIREVEENNNCISLESRKNLARSAFNKTAYYDSLICNWINKNGNLFEHSHSSIPLKKINKLRYGENPHQKAFVFSHGKNELNKLSGKDLSYNNIYDLEIAIELAEQFKLQSCVILKHGNPCGVALAEDQKKAYRKALKCDPISAFGGIVAFNKTVTLSTAKEILKLFTEVVVAPNFESKALETLKTKKNLILVKYVSSSKDIPISIKSTRNFLLAQEKDVKKISKKDITFKTRKKVSQKVLDDLIFGFIVSKFVNSNAIVLVSNLSTLGIGVGQTNRLDSAKQAIKRMKKNFKNVKAIMASDGFFPFPDIVKNCSKNNIIAIIQPGGSLNDDLIVETADKYGIPMAFTGSRHFKH